MKLDCFSPIVNNQELFHPVNLHVLPGEIVTIMGSSGIGKSSLFRAIDNGIDYTGNVQIGQFWQIYQDDNQLFPWMTVEKNLDLSTKLDWREWANRWGLSEFQNRKPQHLSVGQRQRFTLLRAACSGVDTLLCDEALSGVDGLTSMKICRDMRAIAKDLNLRILWITHNIAESIEIGDRCIIIKKHKSFILNRPLKQGAMNDILLT